MLGFMLQALIGAEANAAIGASRTSAPKGRDSLANPKTRFFKRTRIFRGCAFAGESAGARVAVGAEQFPAVLTLTGFDDPVVRPSIQDDSTLSLQVRRMAGNGHFWDNPAVTREVTRWISTPDPAPLDQPARPLFKPIDGHDLDLPRSTNLSTVADHRCGGCLVRNDGPGSLASAR
jgi:hypothetical protein